MEALFLIRNLIKTPRKQCKCWGVWNAVECGTGQTISQIAYNDYLLKIELTWPTFQCIRCFHNSFPLWHSLGTCFQKIKCWYLTLPFLNMSPDSHVESSVPQGFLPDPRLVANQRCGTSMSWSQERRGLVGDDPNMLVGTCWKGD